LQPERARGVRELPLLAQEKREFNPRGRSTSWTP
jgi:hypothetical protein